jgi:CheY-like chemotaxis protein
MDVKNTAEALQLLKEQQARDGAPGVDLILKEHDPPAANACRLLRRILEDDVLRTIPVVGAAPASLDEYSFKFIHALRATGRQAWAKKLGVLPVL